MQSSTTVLKSTMQSSTHSPLKHYAIFHTQSSKALCNLLHTVLKSTLQSSAHSPQKHYAIFRTQSSKALCNLPHTVLKSTMQSSTHSPQKHYAIFHTQFPSSQLQECKYNMKSLRTFGRQYQELVSSHTFFLSRESYRAMETNRGSTSISNLKPESLRLPE